MITKRKIVWCICIAVGLLGIASFMIRGKICPQVEGDTFTGSGRADSAGNNSAAQVGLNGRQTGESEVSPGKQPRSPGAEYQPLLARPNSIAAKPFATQSAIEATSPESIIAFLATTNIPTGYTLESLHGKKNSMLSTLCAMPVPPRNMTASLIRIFRDPAQDSVTRDYVLQHLTVSWYGRVSSEERAAICGTVREGLCIRQAGIAGTALLAMHRLSRQYNAFTAAEVCQAAQALVQDVTMSEQAKLTAIQICHKMAVREVLPQARQYAAKSRSLALMLAAAAMIKDLDYDNPERVALYNTVKARVGCSNCR